MRFTEPISTPVTCGCVAGVVAPAAMKTLGVTVSFEVSPLASATVTPPAGAGVPKVIPNGTDCPNPTDRLAGKPIVPGITTVTPADVSARAGKALAWIVVAPTPTLVTGTVALVAFTAKVTEAGTVATPAFPELKLTVMGAGAGTESCSARFWVVPMPVIVRADGAKLSVPLTSTDLVAGVRPAVDAITFAVPKLTPVTLGTEVGVVAPSRIKTLAGETVRMEVSLLASATKTPPAGAGLARVTWKAADWPG